jgi:4-hydroxy-3-polyprenylbenzoate decarboxylase
VGASIASGSFSTDGMIVAPCSMKTLASVAHGLSDNLITRAADVTLKERRRLVLMVRETPFNLAHLRNMTAVTEMGGIIFPPLPAFYNQPASIDEMVDHTVARVLDLFALGPALAPAWPGLRDASTE